MKIWQLVFTILFPLALVAQSTTVTLNGTVYTTQSTRPWFFGGSSGTLALSLQDTSSTGKANSANPPYSVAISGVNGFITAGYNWTGSLSTAANSPNLAVGASGESTCINAAVAWWAQGAPSGDPNGYLALAKRCVDHVEEYMDGAMGCDTTQRYCGRAASQDADWAGIGMFKMAMVYDIVRPQLNSTEITNFANKILNDNVAASGGIDTVACTPQPQTLESGTISASVSSPTITGSGTSFSGFSVGGVLIAPGGVAGSSTPAVIGFISSVNSGTSITLTSNAYATYPNGANPGGTFYYSPPWNANCGMIWYFKHTDMAPLLTPTQYTYYQAGGSTSSQGPLSNLTWPQTVSYFAMGMVLAGDDSRAQTLVTQSYNYFLTQELNYALTSYSGTPEEGAGYPHGRQATYTGLFLAMLQNAVVSPPAIGGTLVKRWAQEFYLAPFGYSPINQLSYGTNQGSRYYQFSQGPGTFGPIASYLLSGTNEGKYLTYMMQQTTANGGRGDYVASGGELGSGKGAFVPYAFIYAPSPANTSQQADYRTLPTQFLFNQNDTSTCTSLGLECTIGYSWNTGPSPTVAITPTIYTYMFSKSDWTTTGSEVVTNSGWAWYLFDHMFAVNPGSIHIYRGAPLLAGDGVGSDSGNNDVYDNGNGLNDSVIMLGTFNTNNFGGYLGLSSQSYAAVSRWAGTAPTGDASSRYAYEMIDLTQAFVSSTNPSRVQRHIAHFKKASTQDYVVVYDDIATSSGEPIYVFNHYFVDNGNATESSTSSTVTLTRGSLARLLTKYLPVGSGTFFLTDEGTSYPGNSGYNNTDRVNICASSTGSSCNTSATSGEFITVHLPSTNTSATMPTLTQPTCSGTGGNCAAVQIADSTGPKVATFARQGALLTGASFTTTHSGTAQYLVAGLDASHTYNVTVGGSPVLTGATVNANDNTLYFESTDGAVVVSASGVTTYTLTVSTSGTGAGLMAGTNCVLGATSYASGTSYSCIAEPTAGTFSSWTGSTCGGTGVGNVYSGTLTANCTVNAVFNLAPTSAPATMQGIGSIQGTAVIQ